MECTRRFLGVVLSLIILLGACCTPCSAQQDGPTGIDIIVLLDASTSIRGSDPDNLRQKSLEAILRSLSLLEGVRNRLAVFRFSDKVTRIRPLTAIFDPEDVSVPTSLENSAGTVFAKALDAAYEEFKGKGAFGKDRELVVLLISDLILNISDVPEYSDPEDYLKNESAAVKRLTDKGCRIYALQLSDKGDRAHWEDISQKSKGKLWVLKTDSSASVVRELAQELAHLAGSPEVAYGTRITVPPYREWMILTLWRFGSLLSSGVVTVTRPDGSVVKETDGDLLRYLLSPDGNYLMYKIGYPQEGTWQISALGGDIETWADIGASAVSLRVREPWRVASIAQPLRVSVSVEYQGRALDDERIRVTGVLTPPGKIEGSAVSFERVQTEDGSYYEYHSRAVPEQGEYTLTVQAKIDGEVLSEAEHRFVVTAIPYLREVVAEGARSVEEPFVLKASVQNSSLIAGQAVITAEIVSPSGQRFFVALHPVSEDLFAADVSLAGDRAFTPGEYATTVYLASGQMTSGLDFPESRYGLRFTLGAQMPHLAEARVGGAHFVNEPFVLSVRVLMHNSIDGQPDVYVRVCGPDNSCSQIPLRDDGVSPDGQAGDGIFSGEAPGNMIQARGEYEFTFGLAPGYTKNGSPFPVQELTTRADFVLPEEVPPHRFVISPLARYSLLAFLLLLALFAWWYFSYYLQRDLERGLQRADAAAAAGNYSLASQLYTQVFHKAKERDILHKQRVRAAAARAAAQRLALHPLDAAKVYGQIRELVRSPDSTDHQVAAIAVNEKWTKAPEPVLEDIQMVLRDGRPEMLLYLALAPLETDERWSSRNVRSFRLRPPYWHKGSSLDKITSFLDTYDPIKLGSDAESRRRLGKKMTYPHQENNSHAGED